jgi:hypothetical protein
MKERMKKKVTILGGLIATLIFALSITGAVSIVFAKETEDNEEKTAYVFIGDSRTTGMDKAVDLSNKKDTFVVAKSGMGYNWFMKEGSLKLYDIKEDNDYDNWIYIFNLGVNDLNNINNYKNLIRELQNEATVYFVAVNPTDDSVGGIQCADIEKFNREMYSIMPDNYINSYDYLAKINGYEFDKRQDGMHYNESTYEKLYDFIMTGVDVHEFVKRNDDKYSAYFYLYNLK